MGRHEVDIAVVGGGIVGLATALRLLEAEPGLSVTVLEREAQVGRGQSSRNSGVLHAGLYYPPGSAKARWCTAGKVELERFAADHGVEVHRSGKVVAAITEEELPGLAALAERARTNGVEVHELDAAGIRTHEPQLQGVAGLWSPATAVIDFAAVCHAMAVEVARRGGTISLGAEVTGLRERSGDVEVVASSGTVRAGQVVVCGGLQADRLARLTGSGAPLTVDGSPARIVPFRGSWLRLRPDRTHLVRGNIYPVPVGGLPFLGVHLTRRVDGQVWIGPNAVLALAREGRSPWAVAPDDLAASITFPGLGRLAREHARVAAGELWRDRWLRATLREVRRYVPAIRREDVRRGPWGVRAQLLRADGSLVDDFVLQRTGRILHVLNAPSPAATASLAIGAELRDRVLAAG